MAAGNTYGLKKTLGYFSLTNIVVGDMIGAGIFTTSGLLLAQLSIAGLPLLASFPTKIALLTAIFSPDSNYGVWVFLGSLGLFFFTIRLIAILVTPEDAENPIIWTVSEKPIEYVPIVIMVIALIILGLFPHIFPSGMMNILTSFSQLQ